MALNPQALKAALDQATLPQARGRLLARGLARGMVWRDGVLPEGGPPFSEDLTADLLDFGYSILALALELRDEERRPQREQQFETREALFVSAQALESAVRRGDPTHPDHGRHLVICAATYHLAGYAAQSFSLLPPTALDRNLASVERALGLLLRRDLVGLRSHVVQWLGNSENSDEHIARRLLDPDDLFDPHDAVYVALAQRYYRCLGAADTTLLFGEQANHAHATEMLSGLIDDAARVGNLPIWWVATLTSHLLQELHEHSLYTRLPPTIESDTERWSELRDGFIAQLLTRTPPHLELWPSQLEAAARSLDPSDDLVVALPTSAGKTRIAELCIVRALADARRVVYVTPLRALSAQVERVLARTFVPLDTGVTSLYGAAGATSSDAESLAAEQIVVATPEKIDFALRQDPNVIDDVGLIVFDEGHMIGLGSREIRYEVLIQRLLRRSDAEQRRIVCLSAMFNSDDPYFTDFNAWLRSDVAGAPVQVRWRPTRQRFATLDWSERSKAARLGLLEREEAYVPRFFEEKAPQRGRRNAFPQNEVEFCIAATNAFARDGHTVLVYSPQRSQVEPVVRAFNTARRQGYLTDIKTPDIEHVAAAIAIGREWLGDEHPAVEGLRSGVGAHHGALPRPFLAAIERLLDAKRLSVVVASPTLAQGIDLSCSVLIFRSLTRFDSQVGRHVPISPAEFANVAGRAGRACVDLDGLVALPSYDTGRPRRTRQNQFSELIRQSQGQRLRSGLAQLVLELASRLSQQLGVAGAELLEYVVNQQEWGTGTGSDEEIQDDEDNARSLDEYLADLDVAIFSLVDPLSADVDELPALLDEVLTGSLWQRTLAHAQEDERKLATALLRSRARWLWTRTDQAQRNACFVSGLGSRAGLFLQERLDDLVGILADLQLAILLDNAESVEELALRFVEAVREEPYFFVRTPPADWEAVIKRWVGGTAFAEILAGRPLRDQQRVQALVQDGLVFKVVWAAEAVRVMAVAAEHSRAAELGDGPAFAFTYGVPTIPAALLCQMGFASRVGALWVARQLAASFVTNEGMREWLLEHGAALEQDEFWDSLDHALLWRDTAQPSSNEYPRKWKRESHGVKAQWLEHTPTAGTRVRIVPRAGRVAILCTTELVPIGEATLPFRPAGAFVDAIVTEKGGLDVAYFGR